MRNEEHIDKVLSSLKDVWMKNSELRLCQLLYNILYEETQRSISKDIFYIEDETVLEILKR